MADSVATNRAPCGCLSVLFHLRTCRLANGDNARTLETFDRVHCDSEDGCVWLHQGSPSRRYTLAELDELFALLASCKEAAEQRHAEGHR